MHLLVAVLQVSHSIVVVVVAKEKLAIDHSHWINRNYMYNFVTSMLLLLTTAFH